MDQRECWAMLSEIHFAFASGISKCDSKQIKDFYTINLQAFII